MGGVLVGKKKERPQEYYLLYYGEWAWEEELGEAFPQLTYCVHIGTLPDSDATSLAIRHSINYYDTTGRSYTGYQGFSLADCCELGIDDEPCGSFYEIRTRQSMPSMLWIDCCGAMRHFDKTSKDGESDQAIKFLRDMVLIAEKLQTSPSPSGGDFIVGSGAPAPPPARDRKRKYETAVKALIEQRVEVVATEATEKLYTVKEIVSLLKRSDEFRDSLDTTVAKGVMRTRAWSDRKKILKEARQQTGLGKVYDNRKKDDKHRNRQNMAPWEDVNNEGRRGR